MRNLVFILNFTGGRSVQLGLWKQYQLVHTDHAESGIRYVPETLRMGRHRIPGQPQNQLGIRCRVHVSALHDDDIQGLDRDICPIDFEKNLGIGRLQGCGDATRALEDAGNFDGFFLLVFPGGNDDPPRPLVFILDGFDGGGLDIVIIVHPEIRIGDD